MLYLIIKNICFTFICLLPVMNPLSLIPIYSAMTNQFSKEEQNILIKNIFIYSMIILICILLLGNTIIQLLRISKELIGLTGGIILSYETWKVLYPPTYQKKYNYLNNKEQKQHMKQITFFPLSFPVTAGVGGITVIFDLIPPQSNNYLNNLYTYIGITFGIILMLVLLVLIGYKFGSIILNKLSIGGKIMIEKLGSFMLLTVANGIWIKNLIKIIKSFI